MHVLVSQLRAGEDILFSVIVLTNDKESYRRGVGPIDEHERCEAVRPANVDGCCEVEKALKSALEDVVMHKRWLEAGQPMGQWV